MKTFLFARILDKRGRPISVGHNSFIKTDPTFAKTSEDMGYIGKHFIHAEYMAIKRLSNSTQTPHTIQIFRFMKNGKPALAKPCPICQKLISEAGIKNIEYTDDDNSLGMTYKEYRGLRTSVRWWSGNEATTDQTVCEK